MKNTELKSAKKTKKKSLDTLIYPLKQVLRVKLQTIKMKMKIFHLCLQSLINCLHPHRDQHLILDPTLSNLQSPGLFHQAQTTGHIAEEHLAWTPTTTEMGVGNQLQYASTVATTMMKINASSSGRIVMKTMELLTILAGHQLKQTAVMKLHPVPLMILMMLYLLKRRLSIMKL